MADKEGRFLALSRGKQAVVAAALAYDREPQRLQSCVAVSVGETNEAGFPIERALV